MVKNANEKDIDVLRKALADDIHKFSMTPNLDPDRMGGDFSAIAIQYRLFALEQRQQGQLSDDVTAHDLPARRDTVRVTFAYGERRPLFDLRTGAQVGTEGTAEIDVPFERPALLGFAEALQPQ